MGKSAEVVRDRYMMATRAAHTLGDLSRAEPGLAIIYGEDETDYIGEWVEGFGFVNVRFSKETTRELTNDEKRRYDGRYVGVGGAARQIRIVDGADRAG